MKQGLAGVAGVLVMGRPPLGSLGCVAGFPYRLSQKLAVFYW